MAGPAVAPRARLLPPRRQWRYRSRRRQHREWPPLPESSRIPARSTLRRMPAGQGCPARFREIDPPGGSSAVRDRASTRRPIRMPRSTMCRWLPGWKRRHYRIQSGISMNRPCPRRAESKSSLAVRRPPCRRFFRPIRPLSVARLGSRSSSGFSAVGSIRQRRRPIIRRFGFRERSRDRPFREAGNLPGEQPGRTHDGRGQRVLRAPGYSYHGDRGDTGAGGGNTGSGRLCQSFGECQPDKGVRRDSGRSFHRERREWLGQIPSPAADPNARSPMCRWLPGWKRRHYRIQSGISISRPCPRRAEADHPLTARRPPCRRFFRPIPSLSVASLGTRSSLRVFSSRLDPPEAANHPAVRISQALT